MKQVKKGVLRSKKIMLMGNCMKRQIKRYIAIMLMVPIIISSFTGFDEEMIASAKSTGSKKMGMLWLDTNLYQGSQLQLDVTKIKIKDMNNTVLYTYSLDDGTLKRPGSLWGFRDAGPFNNYAANILNPYLLQRYWEMGSSQYKAEYSDYIDSDKTINCLDNIPSIPAESTIQIDFTVRENLDAKGTVIEPSDDYVIDELVEEQVKGIYNYSAVQQRVGTDEDFRVGITYVSDDWSECAFADIDSANMMQVKGKGDYSISYTTASIMSTNTDSVCTDDSIKSVISNYSSYRAGIIWPIDMVIPGLKQTNQTDRINGMIDVCHNMVPQGICVTNDYVLISAYCHNLKKSNGKIDEREGKEVQHHSVIYVMDKKSKKYLTTILLTVEDDEGLKEGNHVGGLAYRSNTNTVYIAGSDDEKVWKLPYKNIVDAVSSKKDTYTVRMGKNDCVNTINASFIYWDETYGELFVGNFGKSKDDKSYMYSYKDDENYMCSYNVNTDKKTSSKIALPLQTQGVTFGVTRGKTYCICSKSYGRKNSSELYAAELKRNKDNEDDRYLLTNWHKISAPNMSEDIQISNGTLYHCFESAANFYNSNEEGERPIDRILQVGVQKLLFFIMQKENSTNVRKATRYGTSVNEIEDNSSIVSEGVCGENVNYCLYDNGEFILSGQGNMENFSEDTAPWSAYKDDITSIYIDRGVTGIGEYAFYNCTKLTDFVASEFMNADANFVVGDYAFDNCPLLQKIQLPDISFDIKENAFDESASIQFRSNSSDIKKYTENHINTTLHQHDLKYAKTIEATCMENGYDLYQCDCGYEEVSHIVETTVKHVYQEVERSEAAKNEEGFIKYQCKNCIDTYSEILEYIEPIDVPQVTIEPSVKPIETVTPTLKPSETPKSSIGLKPSATPELGIILMPTKVPIQVETPTPTANSKPLVTAAPYDRIDTGNIGSTSNGNVIENSDSTQTQNNNAESDTFNHPNN